MDLARRFPGQDVEAARAAARQLLRTMEGSRPALPDDPLERAALIELAAGWRERVDLATVLPLVTPQTPLKQRIGLLVRDAWPRPSGWALAAELAGEESQLAGHARLLEGLSSVQQPDLVEAARALVRVHGIERAAYIAQLPEEQRRWNTNWEWQAPLASLLSLASALIRLGAGDLPLEVPQDHPKPDWAAVTHLVDRLLLAAAHPWQPDWLLAQAGSVMRGLPGARADRLLELRPDPALLAASGRPLGARLLLDRTLFASSLTPRELTQRRAQLDLIPDDQLDGLAGHLEAQLKAHLASERKRSIAPAIVPFAVSLVPRRASLEAPLREALMRTRSSNWYSQSGALHAAALEGLGALGQGEPVIEGLSDKSKPVREGAARGFAGCDHGAFLEPVLALLKARRKEVREAAALALSAHPTPEARGALKAAMKKERAAATAAALERALTACSPPLTEAQGAALDGLLAELAPSRLPPLAKDVVPALTWADGSDVSEPAGRWLVGRVLADDAHRDEELAHVARCLGPLSGGRLIDALLKAAADGGRAVDQRRVLYAQAVLGTEEHIERLGADLLKRVKKKGLFTPTLEVLESHARVRGGSPGALWIENATRMAKRNRIRRQTTESLDRLLTVLDLTREQLLDRSLPRLGFDERGAQPLDPAAPDGVALRLGASGELVVVRPDGRIVKSAPRGTPAAAKERLKRLKAGLKRIMKGVRARLSDDIGSDRRWSWGEWQRHFVGHPLLYGAARGLLFQRLVDGVPLGAHAGLFALTDDGAPVDPEGEPLAPAPAGTEVRVPHPALLSVAARAAGQELLADLEAASTVSQLDRPVVADEAGFKAALARSPGVELRTWLARCREQGYRSGPIGEHALISTHVRRLGRRGLLTLHHTGYHFDPRERFDPGPIELYEVQWSGAADDPLAWSEALRDARALQ